MKIDVKDERKIVIIYLSNQEKDDIEISNRVKHICKSYSEKKYTVAVMYSGKENLLELTSDLICSNRKKLARSENVMQMTSSFGC